MRQAEAGGEVAAEGPGQVHSPDVFYRSAQGPGRQLDAGADRALGQLHLPHVLLGQADAGAELENPVQKVAGAVDYPPLQKDPDMRSSSPDPHRPRAGWSPITWNVSLPSCSVT